MLCQLNSDARIMEIGTSELSDVPFYFPGRVTA